MATAAAATATVAVLAVAAAIAAAADAAAGAQAPLQRPNSGTSSLALQPAGSGGQLVEASEEMPHIDFVIDKEWVRGSSARAVELIPPLERKEEEEEARGVFRGGAAHRLLLPRRVEDRHFLGLLDLNNVRVELLPHRSPDPHVHVRISTDAVMPFPPQASPKLWFLSSWFPPRRHWLLVFQAVVHMPEGVSLLSCVAEWRWAQLNAYDREGREASSLPVRVLEVTCPRRPRGFLALPTTRSGEGQQSTRDKLLGFLRLAFIVMLGAACVAQVVLLLICFVMLLAQGVRRGWPHGV